MLSKFDTDTTYKYKWLFQRLSKSFSVKFKVRAKNDVHIGLSPENNDKDKMYEIGKSFVP